MTKPIHRIRASSWGALFDCGHKWEGEHLLKMYRPTTMPAHLGTCVHEATAFYDQSRNDGTGATIDDAIDVFMNAIDDPEVDIDVTADDLRIKDARIRGASLVALYCQEISPKMQFVAIEQSLPALEVDCGDLIIQITGTMDRARAEHTSQGVIVTDIKTGRRLFSSDGEVSIKGRSAQCGIYQLMYEHQTKEATAGSQILALSTGGKAQAGISKIWDAKRVIIGVPETFNKPAQPGLIDYAADMLTTGHFPPNPNSQLCSEKYCARWHQCIYKDD